MLLRENKTGCPVCPVYARSSPVKSGHVLLMTGQGLMETCPIINISTRPGSNASPAIGRKK